MFSSLIGLAGILVSLIGWFKHKSVLLLLIGTGLYAIESLLEWKNLNINAKKLDLVLFVIGCIVALFIDLPFYVGGMLALNFYSALTTALILPGLIMQVAIFVISVPIEICTKISSLFSKEDK